MSTLYKLYIVMLVALLVSANTTQAQTPLHDPAWVIQPSLSDTFRLGYVDTTFWFSSYPWGAFNDGAEMNRKVNLTFGSNNDTLTIKADTLNPNAVNVNTNSIYDTNSGNYLTYAYQGGVIETTRSGGCGTDNYRYGYIEVLAKYPAGKYDYWPAFWLWSACNDSGSGPHGPSWYNEIDIAENGAHNSDTNYVMGHYMHMSTTGTNPYFNPGWNVKTGFDISAGYHKYAVEWEPYSVTYYVDDQLATAFYDPTGVNIPQHAMAAIIDFAVDPWSAFLPSNWTLPHSPSSPTHYPAYLKIQYMKYYKLATNCSNNLTICTPATDYSTRAIEENITTGGTGTCTPTFNTSDYYTLRATTSVTLGAGTTINANGSGIFAIEILPCSQ